MGVLPIDQLKEHTGPVSLLVKRLPQEILEATYGLNIKTRRADEGGDGSVTAENFLVAYAIGRGYTRSGQGNPDEARSARYILKDYVNGKLLFCHPPPGISDTSFNEPTHKNALVRVAGKKQAPLTRVGKDSDTFVPSNTLPSLKENPAPGQSSKSRSIDLDFFEKGSGVSARPFIQENGKEFSRSRFYPHQNIVADNGIPIDPSQHHLRMQSRNMDKKHKKIKRVKQRSGKGYD